MTVVLLLGASGFIGRHVAESLRGTPGIDLVEARRDVDARHARSPMLGLDFAAADKGALQQMVTSVSPAAIVNCAGRTTGSMTRLIKANVLTVASLLDALQASADRVRVVHVGSAAEYGRGLVGEPVGETTREDPVSAYGVSKVAATRLITIARDQGVEGAVLRVFNAIGPGMSADTLPGSIMGKLVRAMASGSGEIATGPLSSVRDFVDVRDVGRAVVAACTAPELSEPILNIGSGTGHTARDLVEELARQVGFTGVIREGSMGSTRSRGVPWQVANISKAIRALDWGPVHDLTSSCEFVVRTSNYPGAPSGAASK